MPRQVTADGLDLSAVTRLLTDRPVDGRNDGDGVGDDARCGLSGELPPGHPLFGDVPGQRHDSLVFLEVLRQAGPHLGHRRLGVPAARPCLFSRLGVRLADTRVWSGAARAGAALAVDLRAAPTVSVGPVPRGLRVRGALDLDGVLGCTGSAELVCLAPGVARNHRADSRLATLAAAARTGPALDPARARPADPAAVGRGDPANVVVSEPVPTASGELASAVFVAPGHPVFFAEGTDAVPGLLLVEAVRQSALLASEFAVGRGGLVAELSMHIRGFAELDVPVTCLSAATAASPVGGGELPGARVRVTVVQAGRVVVEAGVAVVGVG